ncbi:uncharacterized protein LOC119201418 [Pungitius pungitius]|uniref:uncharacterized protein LOC119201418 n=1 Tax=Pungitius pungitius TaxID=134920 RepID=UPI002E14DBE3
MPRGKSFFRSEAAKFRMAERSYGSQLQQGCGTGRRHFVRPWPKSSLTGRQRKLVIPPKFPDKKLVLVLGCSHLRAIADGFVTMPDGILTFGFLSIPGGSAADLKLEIENTVLTHQPDALCVLAPSNNLTASRSVSEAGADFAKLMTSVTKRFPNVFVLDFPPRLNCEVKDQDLLRQEFRDVTARMSVKYCSIAEYFPLQDRKLWVRDGVHLSDDGGMKILVKWLAHHSYQKLHPPPEPQVSFRPSVPVVTPAPKPQRSPSTRRTAITPEPKPSLLPSTPAVKPLVGDHPVNQGGGSFIIRMR